MAETETEGLREARLREIAARIDLLNNTEYLMSADGKHYLLPEARTACDILASDDGPALVAEVRRLRTILGNLLALAPEGAA